MEKISYNSSALTVQEALQIQTEAILAGLELQREILQAVRELQLGDDAIGNAVARYGQKMAVVNGGVV